MGKAFYSWQMQNDPEIQGTVVRSTTIPEELGRISYVLTDKTGTLTQNEMVFKKIHLGIVSHDNDTFHHIGQIIQTLAPTILAQSAPGGGVGGNSGGAGEQQTPLIITTKPMYSGNRMRHPEGWREWEAVKALALCHNVTPITDEDDNKSVSTSSTYTSSAGGWDAVYLNEHKRNENELNSYTLTSRFAAYILLLAFCCRWFYFAHKICDKCRIERYRTPVSSILAR